MEVMAAGQKRQREATKAADEAEAKLAVCVREAKARANLREAASNAKAWFDAAKEAREDAEKKRAESDRLNPASEE